MTVIETSKRLEKCAKYLCDSADSLEHATMFGEGSKLAAAENRQWAADIRSLIIPEPLGSNDEKVEQHITCSVCGLIARIKYGSMEDVRPVSLRCSCGAITPYENQKD